MNSKEFLYFRKKLNKTQSEMAQLLITSIKAVRSYEQGWRSVPAQVERQIFFLVSRKQDPSKRQKPCWITKKFLPNTEKNARHGNSKPGICAGLSVELFGKEQSKGIGTRR